MDSAPAQQPTLTVEQARLVLSEVIQAFSVPENSARMEEARECACNMDKMLQLVLPMATQIQQEVIKAYGFNEGEGSHFVKPVPYRMKGWCNPSLLGNYFIVDRLVFPEGTSTKCYRTFIKYVQAWNSAHDIFIQS